MQLILFHEFNIFAIWEHFPGDNHKEWLIWNQKHEFTSNWAVAIRESLESSYCGRRSMRYDAFYRILTCRVCQLRKQIKEAAHEPLNRLAGHMALCSLHNDRWALIVCYVPPSRASQKDARVFRRLRTYPHPWLKLSKRWVRDLSALEARHFFWRQGCYSRFPAQAITYC